MTVARRGGVSVFRLLLGATLACVVLSVGCKKNTIDNGTPTVTLASTNAKFTSFIVNIDSITLTRSDNNVFTALAAVQRVDLAHTSDLAELLESPAIPTGTYKQMSITVDYTTATEITVDANGQAKVLVPVDNSGTTLLSTQTIQLNLDENKPLVINKGQSVRLDLHFDLPASTTIDMTNGLVTVYPFVVASVTPTTNPTIRARGGFLAANQGGSYFVVNGRPFIDLVSSLGALQINVSSNTYFDINGTAYTGSAGLAALSKAPVNTTVVAYGSISDLSKVTPIISATEVYAGTSQETLDHVMGVVAARSGNTLTLRGAELVTSLGSESFSNRGTVILGSTTKVTQDGQPNATGLDLSAISVGQRIDAGGGATTVDSAGNAIISVDASGIGGEVRLQSTRLWGTLNSASAGTADLKLLKIENYSPAGFDFTGTGATAPATPADYLLGTGSSTLSGTGSLWRVDGRVTPFGTAPPDFTVSNVVPGASTESVLEVEWTGKGTTAPFRSLTASGVVIDLSNAALGAVHVIETGGIPVDLMSTSGGQATPPVSPTIVPDPNATNFSIGGGSTLGITTYSTYSTWESTAQSGLNGTNTVRKFVAVGTYNPVSNTFSATRMDLVAH